MSTGLLFKSIMNMLITSFPPWFHFPKNDRICAAEKQVCCACGRQSITLNEALEMYINTPLWVYSTQNTSVEGISIFDILEEKNCLILFCGFRSSVRNWYAFINRCLMRRLHLHLKTVM